MFFFILAFFFFLKFFTYFSPLTNMSNLVSLLQEQIECTDQPDALKLVILSVTFKYHLSVVLSAIMLTVEGFVVERIQKNRL